MEATDLFVGVPVTSAIQESLDAASLPFRRYFEGGKFLTVVDKDGAAWLGKIIGRGASPDRLDDMKRHVESVILKIDPETEIPNPGIQVIDLPPAPPEPEPEPETDPEEAADPPAEAAPAEEAGPADEAAPADADE